MTPIKFPQANAKLVPGGQEFSMDVESIEPVHGFTNGEQFITRWQPTPEEREAIADGADVWLQVLSGSSMPPVAMTVSDNFFSETR